MPAAPPGFQRRAPAAAPAPPPGFQRRAPAFTPRPFEDVLAEQRPAHEVGLGDSLLETLHEYQGTFGRIPTKVRATLANTIAGTNMRASLEGARELPETPEQMLARFRDVGIAGAYIPPPMADEPIVTPKLIEELRPELAVIHATQPDLAADPDESLAQRSITTAATSLAQSAPALAAGIITRNPAIAASMMYLPTAGQKTGELVDFYDQQAQAARGFGFEPTPEQMGRQYGRALEHGNVQGTIESATELLPFGAVLKRGSPLVQRVAEALLADLPGESIATVTQAMDDVLAKSPEGVTLDELKQGLQEGLSQVPETLASTVLAGGAHALTAQLAEGPEEPAAAPSLEQQLGTLVAPPPALPAPAPLRVNPAGDVGTPEQHEALRTDVAARAESLGLGDDIVANLDRLEQRKKAAIAARITPALPNPATLEVNPEGDVGRPGELQAAAQADDAMLGDQVAKLEAMGLTPDIIANLERLDARAEAARTAPPALPPPDSTVYVDEAGRAGTPVQQDEYRRAGNERAAQATTEAEAMGFTPDVAAAAFQREEGAQTGKPAAPIALGDAIAPPPASQGRGETAPASQAPAANNPYMRDLGRRIAQAHGGVPQAAPAPPAGFVRRKRSKKPDATTDSALEFIAKQGGINMAEAEANGIDRADMRDAAAGIRAAFTKKGMSVDRAAELLHEAGYDVVDPSTGRYDANRLLDVIDRELRGQKSYSNQNTAAAQEAEARRGEAEDAEVTARATAERRMGERAGPTRRRDLEQRKKVAAMSPDELRKELLTHELTGLPNRRAYNDAERLPHQVAVDVDSLKWVNDNMGHESGDALLKAVGQALSEATDRAYHLSGDEFVLEAATPEERDALLEQIDERLAQATIEVTKPDGSVVTVEGLGVSYGRGNTLQEADADLGRSKQAREATGQRAARGQQPPGATIRSGRDEGRPDHEGNAPADQVRESGTNEELGFQRAREAVEEQGVAWKDIEVITDPHGYRRAVRRYGLPNAISEREDHMPFGRSGALFVDEDTGKPVAYAPSSARPAPRTKPYTDAERRNLFGPEKDEGRPDHEGNAPADVVREDDAQAEAEREGLVAFQQYVRDQTGLGEFTLRALPNGDIRLETMAAKETGHGAGTRAMELLTDYADRHDKRLVLGLAERGHQPIEDGPKTTSRTRLKGFYKRFGFVQNKGRHKDFTLSIYDTMYRDPQRRAVREPGNNQPRNQLSLFTQKDARPGTNAKQIALANTLLNEYGNRVPDPRASTGGFPLNTLAGGFAKALTDNHAAMLVGQRIRSSRDLADLAQRYRDPRFETLRYIFMKGDRVIGETGVSARLPGSSGVYPATERNGIAWLFQMYNRMGADGLRLLHNHPSGASSPSKADIKFTKQISRLLNIDVEHVVLDSNEYSEFKIEHANGYADLVHKKTVKLGEGKDELLEPAKPHRVLGMTITEPDEIVALGRMFQRPGWITVVGVTTRHTVRSIGEMPEFSQHGDTTIGQLKAALRRWAYQNGNGRIFLVGNLTRSTVLKELKRESYVFDAITPQGDSLLVGAGDLHNELLTFGGSDAGTRKVYEKREGGERDLLGDDVEAKNKLAQEERDRDARRSPNRDQDANTGKPGDLFTRGKQLDLEGQVQEPTWKSNAKASFWNGTIDVGDERYEITIGRRNHVEEKTWRRRLREAGREPDGLIVQVDFGRKRAELRPWEEDRSRVASKNAPAVFVAMRTALREYMAANPNSVIAITTPDAQKMRIYKKFGYGVENRELIEGDDWLMLVPGDLSTDAVEEPEGGEDITLTGEGFVSARRDVEDVELGGEEETTPEPDDQVREEGPTGRRALKQVLDELKEQAAAAERAGDSTLAMRVRRAAAKLKAQHETPSSVQEEGDPGAYVRNMAKQARADAAKFEKAGETDKAARYRKMADDIERAHAKVFPADAVYEPIGERRTTGRRQTERGGRRQQDQNRTPQGDKGYARIAQKAIDLWNDKVGWRYGPLGKLIAKRDYLAKRYLALGKVDEAQDIAKQVRDGLEHATPADRQAVYEYLTNKEGDSSAIDDRGIRKVAQQLKHTIDVVGQRLVSLGLLSEEAYEAHAGEYLPRLYLKHVLEDAGTMSSMGTGLRTSDQGYLKRRKDIDEETRKVLLGEITDPGFLASFGLSKTLRDIALVEFLESVSRNKQWVPDGAAVEWRGRQVSPFWLEREAIDLRRRARAYDDVTRARAEKMADQMDETVADALARLGFLDKSSYEQIPNSARYGALRGLWVRKEIYNDLVGANHFLPPNASVAESILGDGGVLAKATSWWKFKSVLLNPPTQVRNFISNLPLLHLSGVPARRVYSGELVGKAINSIAAKDKYYKIAKRHGLFATTFANVEGARIRDEWIAAQKLKGSGLAKARAFAGRAANTAGDVYALTEAVFKIAKIRDAMEREGKSATDAVVEAQEALFDYSLVPRSVRYARNQPLGAPFITFFYKALGQLAKTAVKSPMRFAPYAAVPYLLSELLQHAYDVDDDDIKRLRKAFPAWMRERGHMLLLPFKDERGRWQVVDMGYLVPWGQLADMYAAAKEGKGGKEVLNSFALGGPLPDVISAIETNTDGFTGDQIINAADPPELKLKALTQYVWNLAMPPFLTDKGAIAQYTRALQGQNVNRRGEPGATATQAALRLFGINVYPVDPEKSRAANLRGLKYEMDEVQARGRELMRDRNLTPAEREELRATFAARLRELSKRAQDYARESEINDKLK